MTLQQIASSEMLNEFIECCRYGELENIKEFIKNSNAKEIQQLATTKSENNQIAIFMLAANGHCEILENLLPFLTKDDLNIKNIEGNTCLHWAALNNQSQIIDLLLKAGVEECRNLAGFSSATLAEERGFMEVANKILLSYDPEENEQNESEV